MLFSVIIFVSILIFHWIIYCVFVLRYNELYEWCTEHQWETTNHVGRAIKSCHSCIFLCWLWGRHPAVLKRLSVCTTLKFAELAVCPQNFSSCLVMSIFALLSISENRVTVHLKMGQQWGAAAVIPTLHWQFRFFSEIRTYHVTISKYATLLAFIGSKCLADSYESEWLFIQIQTQCRIVLTFLFQF